MAEKKPSIHKTLLILILVMVPPYWLIFTDDGTRLTDTALLWVLGEDEIKFNIRELDGSFTREDIEKAFSDNEWHCGEKDTPFGDSLCATQIGAFNGYPSHALTLFFRNDNITAFKLIYREPYHEQLISHFIRQFGQPSNVDEVITAAPDAKNVLEWDLGGGVLLMTRELGEKDEPSLLWLAAGPGSD